MTCRQQQLRFRYCLMPNSDRDERVRERVPTVRNEGTNRVPSCAGCVAEHDRTRGRLDCLTERWSTQ